MSRMWEATDISENNQIIQKKKRKKKIKQDWASDLPRWVGKIWSDKTWLRRVYDSKMKKKALIMFVLGFTVSEMLETQKTKYDYRNSQLIIANWKVASRNHRRLWTLSIQHWALREIRDCLKTSLLFRLHANLPITDCHVINDRQFIILIYIYI